MNLPSKVWSPTMLTMFKTETDHKPRTQPCLHCSRMDTIILFSYLGFAEQLKYLLNAIKTCHSSYVRKNT